MPRLAGIDNVNDILSVFFYWKFVEAWSVIPSYASPGSPCPKRHLFHLVARFAWICTKHLRTTSISIYTTTPSATMAGPNNGIVAAMADTQSTPTGLNNHGSREIADVAQAESAVTPDPGEAGPDTANGDPTGLHKHAHEHEHEHDITVGDNVHEEDDKGSVDDTSDLISEADEAITAVKNGLGT